MLSRKGSITGRKWIVIFVSGFILFFSLTWFWSHGSTACNPFTEHASGTRYRIVYDQPNLLSPPKTSFTTLTPWLAPIIFEGTYNLNILNALFHQRGVRIGLTVFAVRKYNIFVKTLIETAEQFFMAGHKVSYYVFTDDIDAIPKVPLKEGRSLLIIKIPGYKRWQDITMRRMQLIRDYISQRLINEVDYLACLDADMKFTDDVGVEILSDLFGVIHHGYFGKPREEFTYERRNNSEAYIPVDEGDFYYTGCFFGGSVVEVYRLTNFCHNVMLADKARNIEALWHDESYLNKYFLHHKPTKLLSPEYAWNDYGPGHLAKKRRIVHVPKDYNVIRD
uniref:Histo-blood group ABO system transferase n=1 Tax=Xenopus tropicalis TaxID=8364 RepID=A0A803JA71_XENTR